CARRGPSRDYVTPDIYSGYWYFDVW
nr:immunoglobulin heavy chain junction region [Macaca mulatta]